MIGRLAALLEIKESFPFDWPVQQRADAGCGPPESDDRPLFIARMKVSLSMLRMAPGSISARWGAGWFLALL